MTNSGLQCQVWKPQSVVYSYRDIAVFLHCIFPTQLYSHTEWAIVWHPFFVFFLSFFLTITCWPITYYVLKVQIIKIWSNSANNINHSWTCFHQNPIFCLFSTVKYGCCHTLLVTHPLGAIKMNSGVFARLVLFICSGEKAVRYTLVQTNWPDRERLKKWSQFDAELILVQFICGLKQTDQPQYCVMVDMWF